MTKLEQTIQLIENDAYGTDPEQRQERTLAAICINLTDICNLIDCGRIEPARQLAERTLRQAEACIDSRTEG